MILEAEATDAEGVAIIECWRWDNEDEEWVLLGEDDEAPYQSSVAVDVLSLGENVISADAYDEADNWIDEWIYLNRTNSPPPPPPPPAPTNPVPPPPPPTETVDTTTPTVTGQKDKKKDKKKGKKGKGKKKKR